MLVVELGGDALGHPEAPLPVGVVEGAGELTVDGPSQHRVQVVAYIPALVQDAPLHDGPLAEDALHAGGERLGTVDDEQDPGLVAQAAGHEIGQQVLHDGAVLGVAIPQPDGDLGAVGGDDQRRHAAAVGEHDPVDHHRGDVELGQVPADELGQRRLGGRLEATRYRRLRVAACHVLQLVADGLGHQGVAAGGDPGQHPLHRDLGEQIGRREHRVGVQVQLAAIGQRRPGTAQRHCASPEHDRPGSGAVASGDAIRVVATLRADLVGHFFVHDLAHRQQAGAAAERHQPFADRAGHIGHGDRRLHGQLGHAGRLLPLGHGHDG